MRSFILLLSLIVYTLTDAVVSNSFSGRGGASALRRRQQQQPIVRRWLLSSLKDGESQNDEPFQNDTSPVTELLYSQEKNIEVERLSYPLLHFEPRVSQDTIVSIMSFLSASGDVICMKRHGGYANMMTGNIIRLAGSISEQRWGDSWRSFSLIMNYMIGNLLFRFLVDMDDLRNPSRKSKSSIGRKVPPLVSPACLLLLFLGEVLHSMPLLAMTGGLLNAATAHACSGAVVFAMTGHLSRVLTAAIEYPSKKVWNAATTASFKILVSFLLGAMCTTTLWNQGSSKPWFIILGLLYSIFLTFISFPKSVPKSMFSIQTMNGNFTSAIALES
jgi:uncharacterized membrane protein YoaK (UPF0700 family)